MSRAGVVQERESELGLILSDFMRKSIRMSEECPSIYVASQEERFSIRCKEVTSCSKSDSEISGSGLEFSRNSFLSKT